MSPRFPLSVDRIEQAAQLWDKGLTVSQISAELGIPKGTVCSTALRHRDRFPKRQEMNRPIPKPVLKLVPKETPRRTFIAGQWVEHVKRTTQSGAVVTMPKVSFIDGDGSTTSTNGADHD